MLSGGKVRAFFVKPQRAISPGQTLAAYKGSQLIGSGVIE
jgi:tRNA U34 2-thiouridine synthase MnmA/TrmU